MVRARLSWVISSILQLTRNGSRALGVEKCTVHAFQEQEHLLEDL